MVKLTIDEAGLDLAYENAGPRDGAVLLLQALSQSEFALWKCLDFCFQDFFVFNLL